MIALPNDIPRRRPNCALVAMALTSGMDYPELERKWVQTFAKRGNWKGSAYDPEIMRFIAELHGWDGYRVSHVEHQHQYHAKYSDAHTEVMGSKPKLLDWVLTKSEGSRTFIVLTTGHAQVVHAGHVIDQNTEEATPVYRFWGKRKQVRAAIEILTPSERIFERTAEMQQAAEQQMVAQKEAQNIPKWPTKGVTRKVWEICDTQYTRHRGMVSRKLIMDICEYNGINRATASTQFNKWKQWKKANHNGEI